MDVDVVLSAVATDLVGRLIAFPVRKYQEPSAAEDAEQCFPPVHDLVKIRGR